MAEFISNGVKTSSCLQCDSNNEVLMEVTVEVEVHAEGHKRDSRLRGYRSADTYTQTHTRRLYWTSPSRVWVVGMVTNEYETSSREKWDCRRRHLISFAHCARWHCTNTHLHTHSSPKLWDGCKQRVNSTVTLNGTEQQVVIEQSEIYDSARASSDNKATLCKVVCVKAIAVMSHCSRSSLTDASAPQILEQNSPAAMMKDIRALPRWRTPESKVPGKRGSAAKECLHLVFV